MKSALKDYYNALLDIQWFIKVGKPITQPDILIPKSWEVAAAITASDDTENWGLDKSNELSSQVSKALPNDWGDIWNNGADEFTPLVEQIVDRAVLFLPAHIQVHKVVRNQLSWQIGHAFHEENFRDVISEFAFQEVVEWYRRGHYFCGWKGEYPNGQAVIF